MFTITISSKIYAYCQYFEEAIKKFIEKIKRMLINGITLEVLTTQCWIETINGTVWNFYRVHDYAIDKKWINEKGEWIGEKNNV